MKRFVLVLVLVATIAAVLIFKMPEPFSAVASRIPNGQACVYCRSTELPSVDAGCGRIVHCDAKQLSSTLSRCGQVDGVSVSFAGGAGDVERVMQRLGLQEGVKVQQLGDMYIWCGYSSAVRGGIWLDGERVNVQIALCGGTVTVGSPLILGSY